MNKSLIKYMGYSVLSHDFPNKLFNPSYDLWNTEKDNKIIKKIASLLKYLRKRVKRTRHFYNPIGLKYSIFYVNNEIIISFRSQQSILYWINSFIKMHKEWNLEANFNINFSKYMNKNYKDDQIIKYIQKSKLTQAFKLNDRFIDIKIDNAKDSNLQMKLLNFKLLKQKIYIHSGFITLFNELSESLNNEIINIIKDRKKIVFVGHSLGGTLARIAHLVFFLKYPNYSHRMSSFSYGPFKLGNKKLEEFISNNIENHNVSYSHDDLITQLPPISLGYSTPKKINIIENIQGFKINPLNNRLLSYLYSLMPQN